MGINKQHATVEWVDPWSGRTYHTTMVDAGRELDRLIAERVMGDTQDEHGGWISADGNTRYHGDGGPMEYSTDIAAAWQVLALFDGYDLSRSDEKHTCTLWRYDARGAADASTMEHAICLAALRAEETKDTP
jgi:hypothetical protein